MLGPACTLVERFDLTVIDEHNDLVPSKRVDRFRELSGGVDGTGLFEPIAVQRALGIRGLDEAPERVGLVAVVLLDLMPDALPDEIADGDAFSGHTQSELEQGLPCRRLVVDRQGCCQRSPWRAS